MTPNQKKHYNKLRKLVETTGQYLPQVDDMIIEHGALILDMIDDAKKELGEHIQVFSTGARQISPEVNNLRGLLQDFQKVANQLGLTPASRKKLGVEKKKEVKSSVLELRKKPA